MVTRGSLKGILHNEEGGGAVKTKDLGVEDLTRWLRDPSPSWLFGLYPDGQRAESWGTELGPHHCVIPLSTSLPPSRRSWLPSFHLSDSSSLTHPPLLPLLPSPFTENFPQGFMSKAMQIQM